MEEINTLVEHQKTSNEELNKEFRQFKKWVAGKRFINYLVNCKKQKMNLRTNKMEPCNSPEMVACICE